MALFGRLGEVLFPLALQHSLEYNIYLNLRLLKIRFNEYGGNFREETGFLLSPELMQGVNRENSAEVAMKKAASVEMDRT